MMPIRLMDVTHFSHSFIVFTLNIAVNSLLLRVTRTWWQLPDIYETIRCEKHRMVDKFPRVSLAIN